MPRPEIYDSDETKARELFDYAVRSVDSDIIIISHATSPYISTESIVSGLDAVISGDHRSAHSVLPLQKYSWHMNKPINFDLDDLSQTQDICPVLVETSGFYIFHKEDYLITGSRVHPSNNLPIEVSLAESIDIDTPEDFDNANVLRPNNSAGDNVLENKDYFVNLVTRFRRSHQNSHGIKHICFDLDGVLIDSFDVMKGAWHQAMEASGLDITFDMYSNYIGRPICCDFGRLKYR